MARKSKRDEDEREEEREARREFIRRLNTAKTVPEAWAVVDVSMPRPGGPGRSGHTSLAHFLGAFEQTGAAPPFRVKRDYPVVPSGATAAERNAYRLLIERMVAAGQMSPSDGEFVTGVLSSVMPKPSDYL